jgi:hypothetical protein
MEMKLKCTWENARDRYCLSVLRRICLRILQCLATNGVMALLHLSAIMIKSKVDRSSTRTRGILSAHSRVVILGRRGRDVRLVLSNTGRLSRQIN